MQQFLINMIDTIIQYLVLGGDAAETRSLIEAVAKALIADSSGMGLFGAGTVGEALSSAMRSYAIGVLAIYFIVDIYDEANMTAGLSFEIVIRSSMRLLISYLGIQFMYDALTASIGIGMYLVDGFSAAAWDNNLDVSQGITLINKYIKGINGFAVARFVSLIFACLLPYLVLWVTRIIIIGVVIVCALKIAVCVIFSPFALGNFFGERDRSAGWRFIRRFTGLVLQWLVIMVIIWAGSVMLHVQVYGSQDISSLVNDMHDPTQRIESYKNSVEGSVAIVTNLAAIYSNPVTGTIGFLNSAKAFVTGQGETTSQRVINDTLQKGAGASMLNELINGKALLYLCVVQCSVAALIKRSDHIADDVVTF